MRRGVGEDWGKARKRECVRSGTRGDGVTDVEVVGEGQTGCDYVGNGQVGEG